MLKVAIVDYGFGNLYSLAKALVRIGATPAISEKENEIKNADALFLPGVGAFGRGMEGLLERGLTPAIKDHVKAGKPLFGICLGMQFLFQYSEEFGRHEGLGFIEGSVKKIVPRTKCKVPHVGWNSLTFSEAAKKQKNSFLQGVEDGEQFYFVHSYAAIPLSKDVVLGTTEYCGALLTSVIKKGNVIGTQFHPEKSGEAGLRLLKNFVEETYD